MKKHNYINRSYFIGFALLLVMPALLDAGTRKPVRFVAHRVGHFGRALLV